MADRGRDLKVSILSDVDKFDLSEPAGDLENLGDKADSTSTKVDAAFEKIASSSRSNLRRVHDDTDRAKKGLDDFKDEAHSTGREAAASFSGGFADVTDAIQEVAANAFSGFGPAGAAAGLAAAAGIGFVINKINETREKVKELRNEFTNLLLADKGTLSANSIDNRLRKLAEDGTISQLANDARKAKIDVNDYLRAVAGDPQAMERTLAALDKIPVAVSRGGTAMAGQVDAANDMREELGVTSEAYNLASDASKVYAESSRGVIAAQEEAAKKQQEYTDSVAGVEAALKSTGDAQATFAEDVKLSAGDVVKTLQEQTKAMLNYQKNLKTAAERGDAEFLAWIEEQPANVAAAYASGTAKQRDAIYDAWKQNVGAAQGEGVVDGLDSKSSAVEAAALRVRAAAKRGAMGDGPINIPTGVSPVPAYAISKVLRDVQNSMKPVTIPVMLQGVKQPTLSRYVP